MGKTLVAYFSATGNMKKMAKKLAHGLKCDIFEIKPAVPYTEADLNWQNKKSRTSIETDDPSSRPEIAKTVSDMDSYDVIYLGFPIWWYMAPHIINTFLESYDLAGKIIIPFATSGSSQMGKTVEGLKPSAPGADIREGKRFDKAVSEEELVWWSKESL